jgi:hypothetical protein
MRPARGGLASRTLRSRFEDTRCKRVVPICWRVSNASLQSVPRLSKKFSQSPHHPTARPPKPVRPPQFRPGHSAFAASRGGSLDTMLVRERRNATGAVTNRALRWRSLSLRGSRRTPGVT